MTWLALQRMGSFVRTLSRTIRRGELGGSPLPTVFPSLAKWKAHIRRSEFTMIAAESGSFKSTVALWMAVQWVTKHGLLGLYLSADSSELVMAARAVAQMTGKTTTETEAALASNDGAAFAALSQLKGLEWSFEPDIRLETIQLELDAFEEKWGRTPDFLIVDNLSDVEAETDDEFGALRRTGRTLTYVARKAEVAIVALHHTSEDDRYKKSACPPKGAVMGKVNVKQALVVTIGAPERERLPLAVVKSRFGPSDKTGNSPIYLNFNPSTSSFLDA